MVDDERGGNVAIIGDADEHLPLLHGPAQERIARVLVMLQRISKSVPRISSIML